VAVDGHPGDGCGRGLSAGNGERGGPDRTVVENHATPATLPKGQSGGVKTSSGFIILPPGKLLEPRLAHGK
jgi:hypothetical protein